MEIVSEDSPTKNLGESSDTQALHAHFCPNIHPIYQFVHRTGKELSRFLAVSFACLPFGLHLTKPYEIRKSSSGLSRFLFQEVLHTRVKHDLARFLQ